LSKTVVTVILRSDKQRMRARLYFPKLEYVNKF